MTSGFPPITPAFGALKRPPNLECGGHAAALRAVPWAPHSRCDSRHPSYPPSPLPSLSSPSNSHRSHKGGSVSTKPLALVAPVLAFVAAPYVTRQGIDLVCRAPQISKQILEKSWVEQGL